MSELYLYKPYRITDATISIKNKSHTKTFYYGSTKITVKHWKYFIHVHGFSEFPILVYNFIIGGNIPSIVFVFKVDKRNYNTSVQVKQALEVCIRLSPLHASPIMIKEFCLAVDQISPQSAMFRDAIVLSVLENFCGKSMYVYLTVRSSEAKKGAG